MSAVHATNQLVLDFEPGMVERHASLLACVREGAYSHRNPLKTIAADMDMSQSELSRKLGGNPDDPRRLSVDDLEAYLKATGDMNPIFYLVEKYLEGEEVKQRRAAAELVKRLPDILALVKQLQGSGA